ncbi:hypothetical protein K466DRAFT_583474 [Polyporus arcularius HHB13444]|uniref:F-box domain-containing protein n=1 Tax=Polyporus arcularius HHB13444 TaxID=1314778 RepID=A0A5C3PQU7_9APHY|nr:hypothetical protein K466DRAFT_583474 [Polyporus arcularius HHB13444]
MQDSQEIRTLLIRRATLVSEEDALSRELRKTQRSILEIDEFLNSTLPINSLPNEILVKIFRSIQTEPWILQGRLIEWSWLPIQAVCRLWRRVICSDPLSWRTITVYSRHEWLQICLERCSDVHADVTLYDRSLDTDTLSVLSQWTSAVRSLTIMNLEGHRKESFSSWLTARRWPVLKEMDVAGLAHHFIDALPPADIGLTIENAPSLRALRLQARAFHPPAEGSLYTHLLTLKLSLCEWPISFGRLLDVLESMTSIENLRLEKTFIHTVGMPDAQRARIVTLPRLRSFTLELNRYLPITLLLASLNLPAVTSVRVRIDASEQGPHTIADTLPRHRSSALSPILDAITSVHVSADEYADQYTFYDSSAGWAGPLYVSMFSGATDRFELMSRALADFVNVFSHSPITELSVSSLSTGSVSVWVDVFNRFPGLEIINMRDCESSAAHVFWVALSQAPSPSADDDHRAVFCPRLRLVDTVASHTVADTEEGFWTMPRVLRARKERGHMLQELRVFHDFSDHERLNEYLAEVEECVGVLKD